MPDPSSFRLPHLPLPQLSPEDRNQAFQRPGSPNGEPRLPSRPDKRLHGRALKAQVETIKAEFERDTPNLETWKESLAAFGLVLEVSGAAGCELAAGELDDRNLGMKLLQEKHFAAPDDEPTTIASVFVPYGGLAAFINKFDAYIADPEEGKSRKRDKLITSIEAIRRASIEALWTDGPGLLPDPNRVAWWEAWIRRDDSGNGFPDDANFQQFAQACDTGGLQRSREVLVLPEQFVVLLKATMEQLGTSVPLLNTLQELRRPKTHAGFFMSESREDSQRWLENLGERIDWPAIDDVAITLLDTGVNHGHQLLTNALSTSDCDAYDVDAWRLDDTDGHGTQMAGLALFGDLTLLFDDQSPLALRHRLESMKILPSSGSVHEPLHYASITQECMDRPETWLDTPKRQRVYCLTVCSDDGLDHGRPSSWSAGLDAAILNGSQYAEDRPRLACISAGNVSRDKVADYPDINFESSCHDPAQSWNAITVGAYTEKDLLFDHDFHGWKPLAEPGSLCPSSTTGLFWNKNWPIKPDIVMEGGNYSVHRDSPGQADTPNDLQLLTTHHLPHEKAFATTGDTSAAAAQAARYCAILLSENPSRWPETIRALLVHSASWTAQMTGWKPEQDWKPPSKLTKGHALQLVQKYGFGVPDLARARKSARSAVTLITEEVVQPFARERDENGQLKIKVNGYNRHRIPIPETILNEHFEKRVRMRVTLSYYIDPNPTNPLVSSKFRYQGAALRFDVKSKSDTDEQFFYRINKLERENVEEKGDNDSAQWLLGQDNRSRGSLHSDIWFGNAAELVSKDCIAISPVGGWWKLRPFLGKLENSLRYSLVVSVEVEDESIDLYTPIATQVTQAVTV